MIIRQCSGILICFFPWCFPGKEDNDCCEGDAKTGSTSPKMMSLWKHAIESSKAFLLDDINLGPDALLKKVEEFDGISQATEHSSPVLILSGEDATSSSMAAFGDDPRSDGSTEADIYSDDDSYDYESYDSDSFEEVDLSVPLGSLPVDMIAEKAEKLGWE